MLRLKSIILFSFVVIPWLLVGQQEFINPVNINTENGLIDNYVHSITKDRNNIMWFGTEGGLCRYNGSDIKTFINDPEDSTSLSHNRIYDMLEDEQTNTIWVATANGLSIYNPLTEDFSTFRADIDDPNMLADDIVRCLLKDRQETIWASSWTQGIVKYDRKKKQFIRYSFDLEGDGIAKEINGNPINYGRVNSIVDMVEDIREDSILWLASLSGLIRFNKNNGSYRWYFNYFSKGDIQYSIKLSH